MKDLKQRAIRGGLAKISSQGICFLIRTVSLMIMARLLDPKDFGLVGMVTAVTGVFSVFRDFGLSAAAVQRTTVTDEQASTLFWVNMLIGTGLALSLMVMAPFIVGFYREPKLLWITVALATAFISNAAAVQHSAMLERQMRFNTLSVIEVVTLLTSVLAGIEMAQHGYGYWALVVMAATPPVFCAALVWLATAWVPGRPQKRIGLRSMIRFGGTLTLNGFVMYIAMNFDKVLLGRFWGADAVGIYGRAYQLVNIPNDNLNSAATGVAFATLSRLQDEPGRFKSYFLKGYTAVLSLTVPITLACALFAADLIFVFLGPKWKGAVTVFRLLAPSTLAMAIINPMGWLLMSLGMVSRGLKIALVLAPLLIMGYAVGLRHGPTGVAFAYSATLIMCAVPLIIWAAHGTIITVRDVLLAAGRPLLSGLAAAGLVLGLQLFYGPLLSPLPRLLLGVALLLGGYLGVLFYVMGQRMFYVDLVRNFRRPQSTEEHVVASDQWAKSSAD
jgi:PST family polysaccharide transporter